MTRTAGRIPAPSGWSETAPPREVYAKFRLAVVNLFRDEFSYVEYRRWGKVESWTGCRVTANLPPVRQADAGIEVWRDWHLVGTFESNREAQDEIDRQLRDAPVNLDDLLPYIRTK